MHESPVCAPDRTTGREAYWYALGALVLAAIILPLSWESRQVMSRPDAVIIGGERITVEIADTPAAREHGLSGRASLASGTGMLFVFPEDGRYRFWMKDMRFPIDMLWLSSSGEVVGVESDVEPISYPQTYGPDRDARYVLELPAGYAQAHAVRIGDMVSFEEKGD